MSEKQAHTPGPWIWADGYRGLYGAGKENQVLDYAHYEGMWLGHVDEQVANARLLSAAPDLLEALKELIACCDELESWTPPMGSACETARAAIAKATAA